MNSKEFETILKSRTIILSGAVSSKMMRNVLKWINYFQNDNTDPISVVINSPGGEAYSGLGIYDALQDSGCKVVTTVNGLCASAGILALLGGHGKSCRLATPNSRFMIHQPRGGTRGTSSDIQIEAKEMSTLKKIYFEIIAKHCDKTFQDVEKSADRDFWLSAQEALEYGLISKITQPASKYAQ